MSEETSRAARGEAGEGTGEETLSVSKVAEQLGITRKWVYQLMKEAGVSPTKAGGPGRGKGQRLRPADILTLQEYRVRKLQERAGLLTQQTQTLRAGRS